MNIFLKVYSWFRPKSKHIETETAQSELLTNFYNAYNDWLEDGAPEENKYEFSRSEGLCHNLSIFCYILRVSSRDYNAELLEQFANAGKNRSYPFGLTNFHCGAEHNNQHLDPNRIAWVKAHLKRQIKKEFILQ